MNLKSLFIASLFCAASSLAFAQLPFTLNAELPKGMNGQKVYLVVYGDYTDNVIENKFSAVVQADRFSIKGNINKPLELAALNIFNADDMLSGHITLALEAKNSRLMVSDTNTSKNKLSGAVVVGSKANHINQLIEKIESPEVGDAVYGFSKDITKKEIEVLAAYPDQYYSLLKLYLIAGKFSVRNEAEELPLKVFNSFTPELKSSELGKLFYKETTASLNGAKLTKIGSEVPVFDITTIDGKPFSTASLKGHPYVIGFSATWCVPCQEQQKKLLACYHKYRDKGFKVVYFNLDNDVAKWKALVEREKLDWINVSERTLISRSKIVKQFNVNPIPNYLVIDKDGKIIYNDIELKDTWHAQLEDYIKKVL